MKKGEIKVDGKFYQLITGEIKEGDIVSKKLGPEDKNKTVILKVEKVFKKHGIDFFKFHTLEDKFFGEETVKATNQLGYTKLALQVVRNS